MRTAYDILGVPRRSRSSEEAIKTAFHRAAKACHPDLNAHDPTAEQKLRQVVDAYHILKCPEQRAAYDLQLSSHRRAMARRVVASAVVGLASGGVVALAVWLSVSLSSRQVASTPAASLAMEWERVESSGDPRAIWAFTVRNPHAPQSALARSRLMDMIETVDDVSLLNILRLVASHAVAERARERLVQLGALTTKENVASSPDSDASKTTEMAGHEEPVVQEPVSVTAKATVREEPAVQEPVGPTTTVREEPAVRAPETVTTAIAVREEPASHELKVDTKQALEEPAARKLARTPRAPLKRLAKDQDTARPVTAENRSSALFGVGF
jgi:DnaJ domain